MKKTLLAAFVGLALTAGAAMAQVRVGVGVGFGAPVVNGYVGGVAPAGVAVVARPPMPGPGFVWVDGYRGPTGFVRGYWGRPPFAGAYWVAPRFERGRFFNGYWGRPAFHGAAGFRGGFRR